MRYNSILSKLLAVLLLPAGSVFAHPADITHTQINRANMMMSQNLTHSSAQHGLKWSKYLTVSGIVNIDATYANHGWHYLVPGYLPSFLDGSSFLQTSCGNEDCVDNEGNVDDVPYAHDISVNNAHVLFDARINTLVKAHIGLAYQDRVGPSVGKFTHVLLLDNDQCHDMSRLKSPVHMDEAYLTLANFNQAPFYLRVGRQFLPFGAYDNPYPLTLSLTQFLSQTNATALQLGYATPNWRLAVYGSNGVMSGAVDDFSFLLSSRIQHYGLGISHMGSYRHMTYAADLGYINDIRDVGGMAYLISGIDCNLGNNSVRPIERQWRRASAISAHLFAQRGPFLLKLDYVSALRQLIAKRVLVDPLLQGIKLPLFVLRDNTRPWAYSIEAAYHFHTHHRPTSISMGYQRAGQFLVFDSQGRPPLPKYRILADYHVTLGVHTDFSLQYVHEKSYAINSTILLDFSQAPPPIQAPILSSNTYIRKSSTANTIQARLSVHF